MEYSEKERRAIFAIVMAMAKVDGHIDENENSYIEQIKVKLGLSEEDVDVAKGDAETEAAALALLTLSKMEDQKKANVKQMLKQMMTSDSDIDENELALYSFVCNVASLDTDLEPDDVDYEPTQVPEVE